MDPDDLPLLLITRWQNALFSARRYCARLQLPLGLTCRMTGRLADMTDMSEI